MLSVLKINYCKINRIRAQYCAHSDTDPESTYRYWYTQKLRQTKIYKKFFNSFNNKSSCLMSITGLWIRIRIDPHSFSLLDPDPDPGGKICQLKLKKCKEIANNCNFIKFLKNKFAQAQLFLTF